MPVDEDLPDPALVVLVGPSGAGKSTWARQRFRAAEVVSADDLRGVVGSGPHDLEASADAFTLLDLIVAGRLRRGAATPGDTLGPEPGRPRGYLHLPRRHRQPPRGGPPAPPPPRCPAPSRPPAMPAVLVLLDTPAAVCRRRNAGRDRPVPAGVLTEQLRSFARASDAAPSEGWDRVVRVAGAEEQGPAPRSAAPSVAT